MNEQSSCKKIYAVASGKGGVGKSSVCALLAAELNKKGYNVGVLDADITGPSAARAFGLSGTLASDGKNIIPKETESGIKVISTNLLLEDEETPVIWRGPVIAGAVKQFYTDVNWGHLDVMFIDMPPGTGDVPLTVFQSIPIDGVIIVTSPQNLVSMIVSKAVNMADKMNIPVLGVVENMSYVQCPDCGEKIEIFGKSDLDSFAFDHGIAVLDRLPINPAIADLEDSGHIEDTPENYLPIAVEKILEDLKKD